MGSLPDEAVEKSVNGGLRRDPCRCDGVERDTHGAIADRVDRYGEATRGRAGDVSSELHGVDRPHGAPN